MHRKWLSLQQMHPTATFDASGVAKARSTRVPSTMPSWPGPGSASVTPTRRPAGDAASNAAAGGSSTPATATAPRSARAFAAAYAAIEPCQSRWSSATFSTQPAAGTTEGDQWSWKLDSSTASTWRPARTASTTGYPMLPHATASRPAAARIAASMPVVVVLPFVPVTASHVAGIGRAASIHQASSGSPTTGTPAAAAAATSGLSGRRPGPVTTRPVPAGNPSGSAKGSTPAGSSASAAGFASVTVTRAPSSTRAVAAASPEIPAPATSTGRSRSCSGVTLAPITQRCRTTPSATRCRTARAPTPRTWRRAARTG